MKRNRCILCVVVTALVGFTINKVAFRGVFVSTGVPGDILIPEDGKRREEESKTIQAAENKIPDRLPKGPSECPPANIGPSHSGDLQKIKSYQFPGAEPYLSALFARSSGPPTDDSLPVLVSAVSSSHIEEAMLLLDNINNVVRKKYPDIVLYMYDIGLTKDDIQRLKRECRCTIRRFQFEDYPPHVKELKGYCWKPVIVQLVAQEHPFIFWLDTSPRFSQSDLDFLFKRARKDGLLATQGFNSIASRTHSQTFRALGEDPCVYGQIEQMQACFIVLYINDFVRDYFLKPWVGCALSPGCTAPTGDPYLHLECVTDKRNGRANDKFHLCHRFDQSVMNILMYRMYNTTFANHIMKFGFYRIKRLGSNLV